MGGLFQEQLLFLGGEKSQRSFVLLLLLEVSLVFGVLLFVEFGSLGILVFGF